MPIGSSTSSSSYGDLFSTANLPGGSNLPSTGKAANLNNPDLQLANISSYLTENDPAADYLTAFALPGAMASPGKTQKFHEDYEKALKKGDGNAATALLAEAVRNKSISPAEAQAMASQVQEIANANGGGRINKKMRDELKAALGTDVDCISKGKGRAQMFFEALWSGIKKILSFATCGIIK